MSERLHVGYLRRSVATTTNPGNDSREAQEAAIRRLAGDDVTFIADWGISGSGDGSRRPEYQSLKGDIASGRIASVTAYSLTRVGRNTREVLAFAELCTKHDVLLRTSTENLDTSTAMGRFFLTIMAAIGELELETGRERSAAARSARVERHRAAGLLVHGENGDRLPSSVPAFGTRNVTTPDGLTRVVPDDTVKDVLDLIAKVYNDEGSVRGTARRLNEIGVKSPKGFTWSVTPMRRVLERLNDAGAIMLPERNRATRRPVRKPALYAGLLLCHCGRRMTPNVTRGQYYCAASGLSHGRMSVTEKALSAVLKPEAEAYLRSVRFLDRTRADDIRRIEASIERRQAALDARLDVDRISADTYREKSRALAAEKADLLTSARVEKVLDIADEPEWPASGDDPSAMNRHLRLIWKRVQLDDAMAPTVEWRDSRRRLDPAMVAAMEASPDGTVVLEMPNGAS